MEQIKQVLRHYDLGDQAVLNYASHSHDPDMWSHTFEIKNKKYVLAEVQAGNDDLRDDEYERLEADLHTKRTDLKLITPRLEQNDLHSDTTWVLFEIQAKGTSSLLTQDEAQKVAWGETLRKDYFYLPVIYYSERTPDDEDDWYSLRYNEQEPPASLLFYASKVPAGQTLWQAVRHDLEVDFNYSRPKSFVIEEAKPFDTAKTKDGRELTRFLVWVGVYGKFDTSGINPVGTKPFWAHEGESLFNPIAHKYFKE